MIQGLHVGVLQSSYHIFLDNLSNFTLISRNKAPKSHLYQIIMADIEGSKMVEYVTRLAFAKDA